MEIISGSKFKQKEDTIKKMAEKAFPKEMLLEIKELKEGFFNAAYELKFQSGMEVILKVAPPPSLRVMRYEVGIMRTEVETMRFIKENTKILIPEIYFYDDGRTICEAPYFMMEKLEGSSLVSQQDSMSLEVREKIEMEVGAITRTINGFHHENFGYYGQIRKQNSDWFQTFLSMMEDVFEDAKDLDLELGVPRSPTLELLKRHRKIFEEVKIPSLVHWDIWAGNIFCKGNEITGIIDFERCLWADPLMESGFRSLWQNPAYVKGYGIKEFTVFETLRIRWYDLYLMLLMSMESDFRNYEDKGSKQWAINITKEIYNELKKEELI